MPILSSFTSTRQVFGSGRSGLYQPFSRAAFFSLSLAMMARSTLRFCWRDIMLGLKSNTETQERQTVRTLLIQTHLIF